MPGRSWMPCACRRVSASHRCCQAPPGAGPSSSTTKSSMPARLRWYAAVSPAWPAPTTTTSLCTPDLLMSSVPRRTIDPFVLGGRPGDRADVCGGGSGQRAVVDLDRHGPIPPRRHPFAGLSPSTNGSMVRRGTEDIRRSGVHREVVVVGAGQAGLTAAYHLSRAGMDDFVVLDDGPAPGGAWQHRWDALTLRHAHGIHDLPGMALPDDADPDERASVVVPEYFAAYEREFDLPVHRPVRVLAVREPRPEESTSGSLLAIDTDQGTVLTRGVINATGTWQKPFWPTYPGQTSFAGRQPVSYTHLRAHETR